MFSENVLRESQRPSDRDFTEDFHLENGNYFNTCCVCGKVFTGHKRRVTCKLCIKEGLDTQGDNTR